MHLDHVALALKDARPALERLVSEAGATVLFGKIAEGFRWVVLHMGEADDGMLLELLEPWDVGANDFLVRFLEHHGEVPHHLTFKGRGIEEILGALRACGYSPVAENLDDPAWKEAFLHPREAMGVLVQLVESAIRRPPMAEMLEAARAGGKQADDLARLAGGFGEAVNWWGPLPDRAESPAILRRVVIKCLSIDRAVALFGGQLAGEIVTKTPSAVEFTWPGGRHLRLEKGSDQSQEGIGHLEVLTEGPPRLWTLGATRFASVPE
jgi:catechol 2,3-dioxygenase-like lactoylglutathione lyase family enzyme